MCILQMAEFSMHVLQYGQHFLEPVYLKPMLQLSCSNNHLCLAQRTINESVRIAAQIRTINISTQMRTWVNYSAERWATAKVWKVMLSINLLASSHYEMHLRLANPWQSNRDCYIIKRIYFAWWLQYICVCLRVYGVKGTITLETNQS